jgi:hypothetical protein
MLTLQDCLPNEAEHYFLLLFPRPLTLEIDVRNKGVAAVSDARFIQISLQRRFTKKQKTFF